MTTDLRTAITDEISAVLRDSGKPVSGFDDAVPLLGGGLGLDSLEFAVVVVRLEQRLGSDPFNSAALERFPTTFGELVALYEKSVGANVC